MSNVTKSRVAMMTKIKHFEIQEYPIPEISDDEMLVKVEGCGVCGTDVHEYKNDPFGCLPIVLGHEGTGEIVKMGKNIQKDTMGKPLSVGDKIVTSIIPCGECYACKNTPDRTELCEDMGCYGLTPDDDLHLNGWFSDYIFIRKGSTFFKVNEFDVRTRIMIEPMSVGVAAVRRAQTTQLLDFSTKVLIQGCGPIGLSVLIALKTMGIQNVMVIDGNDSRLAVAEKIGACKTFNFKNYDTQQALLDAVMAETDGHGVGFAFQTTGSTQGYSNLFKFIARGGGLCEVGFFVELGEASINPFEDICFKEISYVGCYAYSPQNYPITLDCIRRAQAIGIDVGALVTHRYNLEDITDAFEKNMSMEGIKIAVGTY